MYVPVHIIRTYMYMCTCVQVGVPYRVHMVPVGTVFLLVVTVLVVCCGRQQHRFPGDSSSTAKRHLLFCLPADPGSVKLSKLKVQLQQQHTHATPHATPHATIIDLTAALSYFCVLLS
jgi:hypothetical protein